MDTNGPSRFRRRKPSSSELLFGPLFPHAAQINSSETGASSTGDDLDEDDVFYSGDFVADRDQHNHQPRSTSPSSSSSFSSNPWHHPRRPSLFGLPENFGVLAALPEDEPRSIFNHKASISSSSSSSSSAASSRMISIPTIPKPPPDRLLPVASSSSASAYNQSAPMKVPMLPPALMSRRLCDFDEIHDDYDDDEGDGVMLPPHEIVARSLARSPMMACSVLEGAGRTLKGRDLRQVRNAIFRQTGFLD